MLHQTITAEDAVPPLARGWTPALRAKFLDHLAAKGNVRAACARVGLSTESAYRLRRRDADFARGWAAALALARDKSVQVLADRAIDGVEEDVWYRGEHVGTRRRYDARLLLAHIARLDRLVDEQAVAHDAARFDELLARIAGAESPEGHGAELLPLAREAFAATAAEMARDEFDEALHEAAQREQRKLTAAERDARVRDRELAARNACAEAEVIWDRWFVGACATVGALAGWPGAPVMPGLPGNPLPPAPAERAEPPAGSGRTVFVPRTPSTVSTSALARALAGPASGFVPPPIPRRAAAGRTH